MTIPFELRCQIKDRDWDSLSKKEKLQALAWAMESILMDDSRKLTSGDEKKLSRLSVIRQGVLKDNINDREKD